jgi:hypothetical protein
METLEKKAGKSQLIELKGHPKNGKPLGQPKTIDSYHFKYAWMKNHSPLAWMKDPIPRGANAYVLSRTRKIGDATIRSIQFYQIP